MSVSDVFLPITGAACLLVSVVIGWVLAVMMYVKWPPMIRIFPGPRDLVRSHTDFAMMGGLLFAGFAVIRFSGITLPPSVIVALTVGAVYNPFAFLVKAVNPAMARADRPMQKMGIILGFLPVTYGFAGFGIAVIRFYLSG